VSGAGRPADTTQNTAASDQKCFRGQFCENESWC